MAPDYLPGHSRPIPLIDSGERERLSFWRQHAVAIPTELLEITGWLAQAIERGALTDAGGDVHQVVAGLRPSNVLFLVPQEGSRAYQNWEWCLNYLRIEQGRRRLLQQQVKRAEAAVDAAEAELEGLRSRHHELDTRLRRLADEARGSVQRECGSEETPKLVQLRFGLAEARGNQAASRAAERHQGDRPPSLGGAAGPSRAPCLPGTLGQGQRLPRSSGALRRERCQRGVPESPPLPCPVATRFERELEED